MDPQTAGSGSEPGLGKDGRPYRACAVRRHRSAQAQLGGAGVTLGAWAATLADPVPPSVSQPTLPKERSSSLSQSALRREEAAPRDWGHFVLAGAGGTRWRHRRSDGVPPGRSRRQWWHRYRRPNSPRPFPSPQRRRGRETAAAAPKQPAERQPPRPLFTNRPSASGGYPALRSRLRAPVTPTKPRFSLARRAPQLYRAEQTRRPPSSPQRCRGFAPASIFASQDGEQQRL